MLAIGPRPDLLDRPGQPGRAVGHDQAGCRESAGGEVTAELEPVLLGLAHPQPDRNQLSSAGFGDPPGTDHALLRAARTDWEVDRVEEQDDQLDVVEGAATERLESLTQLRADPCHRR